MKVNKTTILQVHTLF